MNWSGKLRLTHIWRFWGKSAWKILAKVQMHPEKTLYQAIKRFMIRGLKSKNHKNHLPNSDKQSRTCLKTLLIPYQANPNNFSLKIHWINCSSQNSNNLLFTIKEENQTKIKQRTSSSNRNSSLATLSLLLRSTMQLIKPILLRWDSNKCQRQRIPKVCPFKNPICTSETIRTPMDTRTGFTFDSKISPKNQKESNWISSTSNGTWTS